MYDVRTLFSPHALFLTHGFQYPTNAKFLDQEEKDFIVERLKHDSADLATHYEFRFVLQALADWKCWVMVVIYLGYVIVFSRLIGN